MIRLSPIPPEFIEGIGDALAKKLKANGIKTVQELAASLPSLEIVGMNKEILEDKKKSAASIIDMVQKAIASMPTVEGDELRARWSDWARIEEKATQFVARKKFHRQDELLSFGLSYEDIQDLCSNKSSEEIDAILERIREKIRATVRESG